MTVQDDRRQEEQRDLFQLDRPTQYSRIGTDAVLHLDGHSIDFELKSTTKRSMSTVRDFGLHHIEKWRGKHWLFGFYTSTGKALRFTVYASPRMIEPWIQKMEAYIKADLMLADLVPPLISMDIVAHLLGEKDAYSLEEAKLIQKNQYNKKEYIELMDLEAGYSPAKMLEIVRDRCAYLLRRGSTLNNPHIPADTFKTFPKIVENHAEELRQLVRQELVMSAS